MVGLFPGVIVNLAVLFRFQMLTALLVLSFNETPTSLTIQEPAGSWNLRLAATAHEVGLAGQPMLPQLLEVTARGVSLSLSPYAAVVYLSTARS